MIQRNSLMLVFVLENKTRGMEKMEQGLRAVVLGWQKSDKASVINSILGDEVESDRHFVKSVRKDGDVNGRKITLINTPCWWQIFGLQDSPEVVKQELVCSVFKCPPGPHVFLLVINLSLPFTEENRLSIEKHFSLFGERIWRHTIVLFTRADSLKDRNIEQHIKNQDLQQIIQRCGQRYHVFDFKNKSVGVKDLLDKIDDVVATNSGKHFETHDDMLLEIKRKRDENEDKAKARQQMLQDKRKLLNESKAVAPLSEIRIVLLGWILSGKSSTIQTIFNDVKVEKGDTEKCPIYSNHGRKITVLDTPGCWKYFSPKFNPKFLQAAILESIGQSQHMQFPHAVILVIPVDTAFNIQQKCIIKEYMAILGEDVWRHTIVLFTWGDRIPDVSIEQHIESEGDALQWLIEKCRNRYHVFDNTDKNNRDQVTELLQKIDEMVTENSLFCLKTASEVNVHETDTQQDEERSLNTDQLLKLMYQEMKNRRKEIKRKLGMDKAKSFDSMEGPPELSTDEKLMEKIRREGSRWEAIIMDSVLNIQNPEVSYENLLAKNVLGWFQKYEDYSQSETSGCETSSEFSDLLETSDFRDNTHVKTLV